MKLYAIRDRETGELYRVAGKPEIFTKPDTPRKHLVNEDHELVTFREEPTEPCECCYFMSRKGWEFCGECGRRLRDE